MNRILQIVGILLLLNGCYSRENDLQKNWIGKYSAHDASTEGESISRIERRILKFKNDSLTIKKFYYDFISDTSYTHTSAYDLENNLLIVFDKDKRDTIKIELFKDSIALVYYDSSRTIFEKLPKYELASKESELYEFLISSSFEMLDSIRVEFRENATLIIPNFNVFLGDNQIWMIDKFEEELFLVIDGIFGFVLQISEINSDNFRGTIYGKPNKEIVFRKLTNKTQFEIEKLAGEWIEVIDKSNPPPPPIFDKKGNSFEREHLNFNDSILVKKSLFRIDTIKWATNREQDLIIFPELDRSIQERKWKIIALNDSALVIERIPRTNKNQIERKIFERKWKR